MLNHSIIAGYAKAVIILIESQELMQATVSMQTLRQVLNPKRLSPSNELQLIYAKGLFQLLIKQPIPKLRETLSELHDISLHSTNEEIVALYAMGLSILISKDNDGRSDNITELQRISNTRTLNLLQEKYKNVPIVQLAYANAIAYISEYKSQSDREQILSQLKDLQKNNTSVEFAEAYSLALLHNMSDDTKEMTQELLILSDLHHRYPNSFPISLDYAKMLVAQINNSQNKNEVYNNLESVQKLFAANNNDDMAVCYAQVLSIAISMDLNRAQNTMLLKKLADLHEHNDIINALYISASAKTSNDMPHITQLKYTKPTRSANIATAPVGFPKPLSAVQERDCLQRIKEGDVEAKNTLIEHNLRLVAHIIKRYYSSIKDQEDLISIGTIGLIKAASTFDYKDGVRFATYASRCIENAI